MTKTTTNLLSASIACIIIGLAFVTGIVNVESTVALYVALPLGAVFFGLFLISRMLEKEVVQYDEEQQTHQTTAKSIAPAKDATSGCGCSAAARGGSSAVH